MEKLSPFLTGIRSAASVQQVVQVEQETPKEEIPKEETPKEETPKEEPAEVKKEVPPLPQGSTVVSVKMVSVLPKAKIRVIKEYKAVSGLPLQEARNQIEELPFIAFKNVRRDEAEELVKKFEEYGAKMNIV